MLESMLVNRFDLSGKQQALAKLKRLVYRKQVLFFHVPKCGGTSLSHALRVRYLASQFKLQEEVCGRAVSWDELDRWMDYKRNVFLYQVLLGTNFVQGHVPYSPEVFGDLHGQAVFITILREPVDRVISHYFFEKRSRSMPFQEYLDSPVGRYHTSAYCRFFGGLPFSAPEPSEADQQAAISALSRFDVVGILEEPEALARDVRDTVALRLRLPSRNVGQARQESEGRLSEGDREKLAEMCRFDTAIYQTFLRRAQQAGS